MLKQLRIILSQVLALAVLAVPVFAANQTNYQYLALGDSVSFGFDPTILGAPPSKYTGYPEILSQLEFLVNSKNQVNASCPGQTSGSYLVGGPDIGCEPFKAAFGLHTNYTGTQASFAMSQLSSNKHIKLVTLSIGGNDLLTLEELCMKDPPSFATCVAANLTPTLQTYGMNLAQILAAIRFQAGYNGPLVLVKYYPVNTDPLFTGAIAALNKTMVDVGTQFAGVKFADGFTAFQLASALFQGDPCKAGLLVRLSATTCDVHPSHKGQELLAATVLLTSIGQ
jgi:lysophospholipase L1-like esterase